MCVEEYDVKKLVQYYKETLQYLEDHEEGMTAEDVYELKRMIEGEE